MRTEQRVSGVFVPICAGCTNRRLMGGAYFLAEGTEEELAALRRTLDEVKKAPAISLK